MTSVVFVGPTLPLESIEHERDVVFLPPVSQGDVLRAVRRRPRAIGIIDGYFSGAPSVWHKEILYAISQSIPVFGSASMGALRAAELHSFGMQGVGRIFESYRDGLLEDDDEVAVIHGPPETGFVPLSEAMVNIRATLAKAATENVISDASRDALVNSAKALFFHRRDWPVVLETGLAEGIAAGEIEALRSWLPRGRLDQKREDAIAMLVAMREAAARPSPQAYDFQFEWTHFWDEMVAREMADAALTGDHDAILGDAILDELRLQGGDAYGMVKARALLRLSGEARTQRHGQAPGLDALRAELARLRAELRLFSRADLDAWLSRNHLGEESLQTLLRGRLHVREMMNASGPSIDLAMLDEMRLTGAYEALAARADAKRRALEGAPIAPQRDSGGEALARRLQFIATRLGGTEREHIDSAIQELGFRDPKHLDRVLRDEQHYVTLQLSTPG
jgi:hypothetical protein